jgi:hypothetical protein
MIPEAPGVKGPTREKSKTSSTQSNSHKTAFLARNIENDPVVFTILRRTMHVERLNMPVLGGNVQDQPLSMRFLCRKCAAPHERSSTRQLQWSMPQYL